MQTLFPIDIVALYNEKKYCQSENLYADVMKECLAFGLNLTKKGI